MHLKSNFLSVISIMKDLNKAFKQLERGWFLGGEDFKQELLAPAAPAANVPVWKKKSPACCEKSAGSAA
jgi:hypothetical protein